MLLVCLSYFYHGFEGQPLLKVNVSDWGNLASPSYWQYISYFFLCPFSSDVLALPIFKQEESSLPSENENMILPFQYVLCAPTSPAVKLHDETLTYLNQGQHQCVQEFICAGNTLMAAKNKNHWQVIHFFHDSFISSLLDRIHRLCCKYFILDWVSLQNTLHEYLTFAGQSYEIRMLDNRKIGELPEITGKMVKVRTAHVVYINGYKQASPLSFFKWIPLNFRALSAWCFTTDDSSTQNISSWKAGAGTGPGIASLIWVSAECLTSLNFDQTVLTKRQWYWPVLRGFISDIPMSVGIIDPRANPTQLNTVEFLWDPSKRTSVFIQVAFLITFPLF